MTSHSIAPTTPTRTDILRGHAILVETPAGRVTRRVFLSLHAADAALARAHARGQIATMVLLELKPVDQ